MKTQELVFDRPADRQATQPPEMRGVDRDGVRLLVSRGDRHDHTVFSELPRIIPRGALLIVNRSAVLPASLPAVGGPGDFIVNLSTSYGDGIWLAEPRWGPSQPGPLPLTSGDSVTIAGVPARLISTYPGIPRLWFIRFDAGVESAMAREGKPIRYGYLKPPHPPLAAYQTIFSEIPGSVEMPSAARPFTRRTLDALKAAGVAVASITLHTGVSSLEIESEEVEDHTLYAEPFEVPFRTADLVNRARSERRPVIAVGTTAVRALESAWDGCSVRAVTGFTRRFIDPHHGVRVVDGLLTGFHDPKASHLSMLYAVAGAGAVREAYAIAIRHGYLWHEFGDSHLLVREGARFH